MPRIHGIKDKMLFQIEQTRFHDKRVTREQIKRATWRSLFSLMARNARQ